MPDFDVVIVGAGADGGVAAHVLAKRGLKVALLEKGRNPVPDITSAPLRGSATTRSSRAAPSPFTTPSASRARCAPAKERPRR